MCFTHDLLCPQPWSGWTEKPEGAIRQLVVCGVFFCAYFLTIFVPLFTSQLLFRHSEIHLPSFCFCLFDGNFKVQFCLSSLSTL